MGVPYPGALTFMTTRFRDRYQAGKIPAEQSRTILTYPQKVRGSYRRVIWFSVCNPSADKGQVTIRLTRPGATTVVLTTVDLDREQTLYWKDLPIILGPDLTTLVVQCAGFEGHYTVLFRDEDPPS